MFLQSMESTTTQALKAHYRIFSQLKIVARELLTRLKRSLAQNALHLFMVARILSQGTKFYARSVTLSLLRSYVAVQGMVQTKT